MHDLSLCPELTYRARIGNGRIGLQMNRLQAPPQFVSVEKKCFMNRCPPKAGEIYRMDSRSIDIILKIYCKKTGNARWNSRWNPFNMIGRQNGPDHADRMFDLLQGFRSAFGSPLRMRGSGRSNSAMQSHRIQDQRIQSGEGTGNWGWIIKSHRLTGS